MGIIQQAMLADRRIRDNTELLEKQMDTLRIVYEHNAISEDEYNSSMAVLERRNIRRETFRYHREIPECRLRHLSLNNIKRR